MKLKLYYAPTTCALAPYVTLTEAGAEFECARINMRKAQHMSPEYMALNPKHKVPMLAIDDWLLTESVAIQTWIGRNFPAAKIMPADSNGEIKAISLMSWISGGIHPYLARINSPPKVADGADESVRRIAAREIDDNFTIADRMLAGREFFFDHFTAVDAHFFWAYRRATQFELPLGKFSHCNAHFARMQQRASVRKVLAFEKQTLEDFAKAA